MGYVIVEDFAGGVDLRKSAVTAPPGTLRRLVNGHITRGGQIEKRKAFIQLADFSGLESGSSTIVIGSGKPGPPVSQSGSARLVGIAGDENRKMYLMGVGEGPSIIGQLPWDVEWVDVYSYAHLSEPEAVTGVDFWRDKLIATVRYENGENYLNYDGVELDNLSEWGRTTNGHVRSLRVLDEKVHGVLDSDLFSSCVATPNLWNNGLGAESDSIGAVVIDTSTRGPQAQNLVGTAVYQDFLAVFARRQVQIWNTDPDPDLYDIVQVIGNEGALAARGIIEYGDADVVYFSQSGIRGLRARTGVVYAGVTDLGSPIDDMVIEDLKPYIRAEREHGSLIPVTAAVNPEDGRLWMALGGKIYVLSYFPGAKVSAWSTYEPGFTVDECAVVDGQMYVRSGAKIYSYGASGYETAYDDVYDDTVVEVDLPFLDARTPATEKDWTALDAALEGTWEVYGRFNTTSDYDGALGEKLGVLVNDTYNSESHGLSGSSSHLQLRLRSQGEGYARLGSLTAHYEGGEAN